VRARRPPCAPIVPWARRRTEVRSSRRGTPPLGASIASPPRCSGKAVREPKGDEPIRRTGTERVAMRDGDVLAPVGRALHDRLLQRVDAARLSAVPATERRLVVRDEALAVLHDEGYLLPQRELARVVNEVSDRVVGFGAIESLLRDPEVSEVMVNGADDVFVERKGRIEKVPDGLFEGEEAVLHVIERIVAPLGLRIDESSPYVDARLPDGSRVHAIVPPLSLCGPALNVRKFSLIPFARRPARGRDAGAADA
jgi:hypothetical protein